MSLTFFTRSTLGTAFVAAFIVALPAQAADIAIFGDNEIGSYYSSASGGSHAVTYVSDAQLSSAGFLDAFDLFVYTRDGSSFGTTISAAAAANVKTFVKGNVVLLNGDFQDDLDTSSTKALFSNVLQFLLSNPKGGYLGEYTGSFAAFASNQSGLSPIGLVNGSSGPSGGGQGGSDGEVQLTAAGASSGIFSGVPFPYNPGAVEYGANATGVNPTKVLAQFDNGNPAIIASGVEEISVPPVSAIPEPSTYAMMLLGMMGVVAAARRKKA